MFTVEEVEKIVTPAVIAKREDASGVTDPGGPEMAAFAAIWARALYSALQGLEAMRVLWPKGQMFMLETDQPAWDGATSDLALAVWRLLSLADTVLGSNAAEALSDLAGASFIAAENDDPCEWPVSGSES